MTSDNATKEELLMLEMKLTADNTKERHEIKNIISKDRMVFDTYKTDQAVINQKVTTMKKNIESIERKVEDWFKEIKELFRELPEHFATKEEHRANEKNLKYINNIFMGLFSTIWIVLIGAILSKIIK